MFRLPSINVLLVMALGVLLSACAARYSAPVADIEETPRFIDSGRTHRVNGGETLYVVAWMYDLDVNALARANNLREPYNISPGQLLTVDLRGTPGANRPAPAGSATVTTRPAVTSGIRRAPLESAPITRQSLPSTPLPQTTAPAPVTPPVPATTPPPVARSETPAQTPVAPPPVANTPEPAPREIPPPVVATSPAPAAESEPSTPPAAATDPDAPIVWAWPTRGNIIGRYSDSDPDNKGIKLAGSEGDAVLAAADGEVVYTGNGLLRYGELVILKHNEHFLSAYAHNKVINVKEGDRVRRGTQIAELGSTGIDRDMLHFEIRLDGKPVDPMTYLPQR